MKKILLILLIILLCGCENKASYYKEVSDVVVNLFQETSYLKDNLDETQVNLIDNYLYELTNPEINVSDFIVYDDIYKTNEGNSPGIYLKDNECYIRYNDIVFDKSEDDIGEDMIGVVCNGYSTVILADSVKPLVHEYDNPKYNYRYLGYYEDNGYHFAYRSYYDGSGLIVTIDDDIKTEFVDVNNLKLKKINDVSYKKYILPAIILIVLIGGIIILKKKDRI